MSARSKPNTEGNGGLGNHRSIQLSYGTSRKDYQKESDSTAQAHTLFTPESASGEQTTTPVLARPKLKALSGRAVRLQSLTLEQLVSARSRLSRNTKIDPVTGCWEWLGAVTSKGYGSMSIGGGIGRGKRGWLESTHVVAMVLEFGASIAEAPTFNHRCENRTCVNPAHIQAASHRENVLYSDSFAALNAAKTTCRRGHALGNAPDKRGRRRCQTCELRWERERYHRQTQRSASEAQVTP